VSCPEIPPAAAGAAAGPRDHGETDAGPTAGERSAALVLGALRSATCGLRLTEMAAATGLPVGQIGTALLTLERGGQAHFVSGCWATTPPARSAS
jgi:hypothetical protein